jgi:23S rRNA pseudouridine955/2504/2580 synthase
VHRLDKETSGILVIARTATAAGFLTRAFREETTRKIYWAIVVGLPKPRQGRIDLALAKSPAAVASGFDPIPTRAGRPSPITA